MHVAGAVRRPGLYRVPGDSRVAEALAKAGGPLRRAEMTAVNLAQPLEDGQQVIVPRRRRRHGGRRGRRAPPAAGGAPSPARPGRSRSAWPPPRSSSSTSWTASGPTLAERIIEFRDEHGGFRSVGQLQEVEGIGEKRFAALEEAVRP